MLRAALTCSACPPELFWILLSSGPCCGARILAIVSGFLAAAAALLYGWGARGYLVVRGVVFFGLGTGSLVEGKVLIDMRGVPCLKIGS